MLRWRRDDPSSMGKKPTTHIVDADREIPATFDSAAEFSLCGVFLYKSEQVDNADPSCQKCLRYRHARRRMKAARRQSPTKDLRIAQERQTRLKAPFPGLSAAFPRLVGL